MAYVPRLGRKGVPSALLGAKAEHDLAHLDSVAFAQDDRQQVWFETVYRRSDTHRLVMLRDAPVGAMWHAPWYREMAERSQEAGQTKPTFSAHPDGRCLMVRTPGGDWCVDQRSSQGGYWRRDGVPPYVTAHPSIALGDPERYHGWRKGGILVDA